MKLDDRKEREETTLQTKIGKERKNLPAFLLTTEAWNNFGSISASKRALLGIKRHNPPAFLLANEADGGILRGDGYKK